MTGNENLDIHLSGLAQWMLQRVGTALLWASGAALVITFALAALGQLGLAAGLGTLAWTAVFGGYLTASTAPLPPDVTD